MKKPCRQCSTLFDVVPARYDRAQYCSKSCQNQSKYPVLQYTCGICNKTFDSPSDGSGFRKYCSIPCANTARGYASKQRNNKETRHCAVCNTAFDVFPSRVTVCCSRKCKNLYQAKIMTGVVRTSVIVPCAYCGKETKKYKSHVDHSNRQFCNSTCFHAWDSGYKSSLEWLAKHNAGSSKIETRVAEWLITNNVTFQQQYAVKHYIIDFVVKGAFVEVNGCYWHGCPTCLTEFDARQFKRQLRDRQLTTYCNRRGIPLIVIWEHDIKRNDFSALLPLLQL